MDDSLLSYYLKTYKKVYIALKGVRFRLKSTQNIKNIPENLKSFIILDIENKFLSFKTENEININGNIFKYEPSDSDEGIIFKAKTDAGLIFELYLNMHTENIVILGNQLQNDIHGKVDFLGEVHY